MPNNPLVSIIIPTFNHADLIGETIDSVLAQAYSHWECIIVDDGSTDNTDVIIEEF
jgi:glycosyltransferase involved in cell wall biosynthesis